jgi:hypothetical protein
MNSVTLDSTILRENPLCYLYMSNKNFTVEVCKKYKFWAHVFNEKRKKQLIPLPWRIGEIVVKNISHLDEFIVHFDNFKLREFPEIQDFEPNELFMAHMFAINYLMGAQIDIFVTPVQYFMYTFFPISIPS